MLFESDESLPPVLQNAGIVWLSPTEISNGIVPILDCEPKMEDVLQGFHGGVFLAGVIALINTDDTENLRGKQKTVIKKLFRRKRLLEYTFYKDNGETEKVQINCLLPTRNGKLVFAQAPNNVYWCPLLEKAYAKFCGGYQNLSLSRLENAIRNLSGKTLFCTQSSKILRRVLMLQTTIFKNPVVCKTRHSDGNNGEYGRGFAVIGVENINNETFVEVRDPAKTTIDAMKFEDFVECFDVIAYLREWEKIRRPVRYVGDYDFSGRDNLMCLCAKSDFRDRYFYD